MSVRGHTYATRRSRSGRAVKFRAYFGSRTPVIPRTSGLRKCNRPSERRTWVTGCSSITNGINCKKPEPNKRRRIKALGVSFHTSRSSARPPPSAPNDRPPQTGSRERIPHLCVRVVVRRSVFCIYHRHHNLAVGLRCSRTVGYVPEPLSFISSPRPTGYANGIIGSGASGNVAFLAPY